MKRREFLNCAAAVSAATCAGAIAPKTLRGEEEEVTEKCKITVIKKELYQDLYEKYEGSKGSICTRFEVGQEFLVKSPYSPPEGFCSWAWADIRPSIHSVYFGSRKVSVACCTDGYRPVVFKVEQVS